MLFFSCLQFAHHRFANKASKFSEKAVCDCRLLALFFSCMFTHAIFWGFGNPYATLIRNDFVFLNLSVFKETF